MRPVLVLLALFAGAVTAGCNQAQKSTAGPQEVQLSVTDGGFEPARAEVPRGQACTLVITRKTDRTCAKEIDRLLSSEWSRGLLMEALLQDRDFTGDYIGRIVEQPEWRAVAQKKLAVGRDMRSGDEGRMSAGRLAPRSADERRFRLTVDGGGFHPGSLTIPAGRPITLVVTRTSDNTCAKEVVFPSLNETRRLPLNQPVEIRIPPQEKGTLTFACGMDMYHGRLVVQ